MTTPAAICITDCTSGCHADDCEHHGYPDPDGLRQVIGTILDAVESVTPKGIGVASSVGFYALRDWVASGLRAALAETTP